MTGASEIARQVRLTAVDAPRVMGRGVRRMRHNAHMAKTPLSAEARQVSRGAHDAWLVRYMMDDVARVAGRRHLTFDKSTSRWSLLPGADCERVLEALDTRLRQARDRLSPGADTVSLVFVRGDGDMSDFPGGASVVLVFERMLPEGAPEAAAFCNVVPNAAM